MVLMKVLGKLYFKAFFKMGIWAFLLGLIKIECVDAGDEGGDDGEV